MHALPTMTVSGHRASRLLALAIALLSLCSMAGAQDTRIVLLASARSSLYEDFVTAYQDYFRPRSDIHITALFLEGDRPGKEYVDATTDLLVTIGTRAAQFSTDHSPDIPVLNTLIPLSTFHEGRQADCRVQSAIFIDQPLQRQALLAELLFPNAHNYGVLLGPTSVMRRKEIEAMDLAAGVNITTRVVAQEPGSSPEAQLLLRQSDLLLAVSDPLVLNRENAKWLLYSAYQQQLPVIGFSHAYVKAGAAAAVYSEPGQMARQAAELTSQWLDSSAACLPEPQFTRYFRIALNKSVRDSLSGSAITEDELLKAIQTREKTP